MKNILFVSYSWLYRVIFFGCALLLTGCSQLPTLASVPSPAPLAANTNSGQIMEERKKVNLVQQETAKVYRTSQTAIDSQVASRSVDKTTSSSRGKEITCSPAVLRPGETLTLKTSKSFLQLGVIQPKKQFLFLVSDDYPEGLASQKAFQQVKTLEIRSDAKVKPDKPVFTVPGVYIFAVSANLETDDGTPKYECSVKFVLK